MGNGETDMKPTFKNEPKHTGLYAVGNRAGAAIKIGGKTCGSIGGSSPHRGHFVQIAIKDSAERIEWRWIMPKTEFRNLPDAKEWVKANFDAIVAGRELHFFEED